MRYVCKNLNSFTYLEDDAIERKRKWCRPPSEFYLGCRPAQKILLQLCKRGTLDDERLALFSSEHVNLISPVIKDAIVSPSALRILKDFCLSSLSAMNMPGVNLNCIIGCLNESTMLNLTALNITGTSILGETNLPILVALGRFKNMQFLNVSRTEFTTQCLQIVADDLPNLKWLNISRTKVLDITPLVAMRGRLQGLIMHRLELNKGEDIEKLLKCVVKLSELRTLDASDKPKTDVIQFNDNLRSTISKLCSGSALPHLRHVDLSGNQFGLKVDDVR